MADAYREGTDAYGRGIDPDANPYDEKSEEGKKWEEGWEDAKIDQDLKRTNVCTEKKHEH